MSHTASHTACLPSKTAHITEWTPHLHLLGHLLMITRYSDLGIMLYEGNAFVYTVAALCCSRLLLKLGRCLKLLSSGSTYSRDLSV